MSHFLAAALAAATGLVATSEDDGAVAHAGADVYRIEYDGPLLRVSAQNTEDWGEFVEATALTVDEAVGILRGWSRSAALLTKAGQ